MKKLTSTPRPEIKKSNKQQLQNEVRTPNFFSNQSNVENVREMPHMIKPSRRIQKANDHFVSDWQND